MRPILGVLVAIFSVAVAQSESITVSGHGEVAVQNEAGADPAVGNQRALSSAQGAARSDAIAQAVFQVCGNRSRLGSKADEIIRGVITHSANVLLEADVRSANVDGGKAIVDIVARIDPKALQEYVEQSFGLTPQQET